jgi:hypothetical protein
MPYTFFSSPFPKLLYERRIDNRSPIVHHGSRPCFPFQPFGEEIWSTIMHHGSPTTLPMHSPLDPVKKRARHKRSGSRATNVSSINWTRRGTLPCQWIEMELVWDFWFGSVGQTMEFLLSLRPERHPKSQWGRQGNFEATTPNLFIRVCHGPWAYWKYWIHCFLFGYGILADDDYAKS